MSRIQHYTESLGGGVLTSIQNTTQAQIESNCIVTIIFLRRSDTPQKEELEKLFAGRYLKEVGKSNLKGYIDLSINAFQARRKSNTDIFHAHSSIAGVAIRLSNIFLRSNLTYYTPHGYAFLRKDKSKVFRIFVKVVEIILNLTSRTRIVSCGKTESIDAVKLFARRVISETNYLSDVTESANREQRRKAKNEKILKVASVGRVTPQKGPDEYVRIVKKLPPDIKAIWIGGGSRINPISSNGLEVTGWLSQQEVREKLSEMDVLLMTSQWEGLSMVGIEAMSLGVPIVSSDYHGVEDLVVDGFNGYICQSEDDYIRNLLKLKNDRYLLYMLKKNARQIYLDNFNLQILRNNWKKMYE